MQSNQIPGLVGVLKGSTNHLAPVTCHIVLLLYIDVFTMHLKT